METPTHIQPIFQSTEPATFREGFEDLAVVLNEKDNALNLTDFIDFYDEFSISFWWKAENLMNEQTLFRQSRFNKFTKERKRYIEVFIHQNFAFAGTEDGFRKVCSLESLPQVDGWFLLTF